MTRVESTTISYKCDGCARWIGNKVKDELPELWRVGQIHVGFWPDQVEVLGDFCSIRCFSRAAEKAFTQAITQSNRKDDTT